MSPIMLRWLIGLLVVVSSVNYAAATELRLQRLDRTGSTPAAEVLSGAYDRDFVQVPGDKIAMTRKEPQWWRLTLANSSANDSPQLIVSPPNRKEIEVWQLGSNGSTRRAAVGPDADTGRPGRALAVPLQNMKPGEVIYFRLFSPNLASSRISIQPLSRVHADDIDYTRNRTFILAALLMVALLSFGYFAAMREHGYAYLGLTMIAQLATLLIEGGEVKDLPWIAAFALDRRTNIVISTAAVLTGIRFLVFFLQLQPRQPRVAAVLNFCSALLGGLLLVSLIHVTTFSAYFGNSVMLVAFGAIAVGIARALRRGQSEAFFLLLAWAPVMATLVVMVGGYQDWWVMPEWVPGAFPAGLAAGGLALMLGLTAKLEQVRRDRDNAQRRWTYDKLTGVITRDAVGDMLRKSIEKAHEKDAPLSVVFVDIDHFKSINDLYGHAAGDEALRIVALRIRNWLPNEHLVARYGGDEMLLVLVGLNQSQAVVLANALRDTITSNPLSIDGRTLKISLSMGVADLLANESPEALLRRADSALYRSKQAGRARVTGYDPNAEGIGLV